VWGKETTELDANWAPKRVAIREKKLPFFGSQWSAVGIDGTKTIIDELVKQCSENKVKLNISTAVLSTESNNNRINKLILENNSEKIIGYNDLVLNTTSLTKASKIFGFNSNISYRGVCLVYIKINKPKANFESKCDFVYVDNEDVMFNRVSSQNKSVKFPSKNDNVLCCEITYSANDEVDMMENSYLIDIVKNDLIKCGFIDKSMFEGGKVVKLPEVYPMFSVGYRETMNEALAEIGKFSNLVNLGSLAEFAYSDLQILFAKSRDFADLISSNTQRINEFGYSRIKLRPIKEFFMLGKKIKRKSKRSFLIAEIGLNHNGSIDLGKKLIDAAKKAGFDAVKFQTYKSEGRSSAKGKTSAYVEKVLNTEESDNTMFKKYELNYDQHKILFDYAKSQKIPFFSAPFDIESVNELFKLGVEAYKIASMEITNLELIEAVAKTHKPVIISSGMATSSDIENAIKACFKHGNYSVAILHCTSIYPAPPASMNIKAIKTMRSTFKIPVGFSDHYAGTSISFASLALGASIIEKHVTIDNRLEGPDHALSLNENEQIDFVKGVRDIEKALNSSGLKQPHTDEIKTEIRFKKTMYFKGNFKKGDVLTKDMIDFKAPAFGLSPKYIHFVIGRILNKDVTAGTPITNEDLL
jgi:sialic acid synthase SpsE